MKLLREVLPLVCILALALTLRLYRITNPIADWHSFRQADTASVTREYVKHGIDLLHPRYHDLSDIQSGKDNPNGYRMVEFPLVNGMLAALIRGFGLQNTDVLVGRLAAVLASLLTLIAIYSVGKELSSRRVGMLAALVFAVLPYSVYYSRVILPEPWVLMTSTTALAAFIQFLKAKMLMHKSVWYVLSCILFAIALLLKPFVLFLAPVFVVTAFFFLGRKAFFTKALYLFPAVVLPLMAWRRWMLQFPEGIPASDWLYNKDNIRQSGAFLHWIFEVRLATLILGIGGIVPMVLGLIKRGKDVWVYAAWGLGLLAYLYVFAGGNVQHDYYQVILVPLVCLVTARGMEMLLTLPKTLVAKPVAWAAVAALSLFTLFVSWYQIRGYYNVNRWEMVEAGQAVDRLTPVDAKVIASYNGDTAFLFQTNRTGWPHGVKIEDKIAKGATYFVSVDYDDVTNALMQKYPVIEKTPRYVVIQLTR